MRAVTDSNDVTLYRLAPTFAARLLGGGLVLLALLVFAYTALTVALSLPPDLIVVVLVVGLLTVFGVNNWLRSSTYVVRLDDLGYHVKYVRGVGVATGTWGDVVEAVAAHPRDIACLVLKRRDGTSTSIPVQMLNADRDMFADDVKARLQRATERPT